MIFYDIAIQNNSCYSKLTSMIDHASCGQARDSNLLTTHIT